jgi:spore maturation protein CgeB
MCATGHPYNGLQKAMSERCHYREIHSGEDIYSRVIEITREFKPDITFMQIQTAGIVRPETIEYLKSKGSYVINFTGDARVPLPDWYIHLGKHFDITLFSNESDVAFMRSLGLKSDFLQLGFDPEIYNPSGHSLNGKDIVFMANNYPGHFPLSDFREKIARMLRASFGESFGLYGSGWVQCDGSFMGNQKEEAACYRGSKIAINCSHYDLERYTSDRMLRLLGSGTMCLTKHYPGIEKDYEDKKHLAIWYDIPDLIAKCEYYLANYEERIAIAKAGCDLSHERDSFKSMVENIINIYQKR